MFSLTQPILQLDLVDLAIIALTYIGSASAVWLLANNIRSPLGRWIVRSSPLLVIFPIWMLRYWSASLPGSLVILAFLFCVVCLFGTFAFWVWRSRVRATRDQEWLSDLQRRVRSATHPQEGHH